MHEIREVQCDENQLINSVADIHIATFQGFFLTFMGKGFLKLLYKSFCKHSKSGLLVAIDDNNLVGFLAYSEDYSDLYKYMIKTRLLPFALYSIGAFFRKPKVFMHLIRAFLKPSETNRSEPYVEIASIGVAPESKGKGVGTKLIDTLKLKVDFKKYSYISLETDAVNNEIAIQFYKKNGFVIAKEYITSEGRKMLEYHYTDGTYET